MTLVEFLSVVKKGAHLNRVISILYFKERYESTPSMTPVEIKSALKTARIPNAAKVNVSDVLNQAGHYVDRITRVDDGKSAWLLTDTGRERVRELHGLPEHDVEIEHDVGALNSLVSKIKDNDVREYLEEALKCLQVGALRATTVFVWTAAIRTLQQRIIDGHKTKDLNTAIQTHDPKARTVNKIDDFSYIKDKTCLLAAQTLGLLDKSEKDTLEEALNLRNKCGHPVKYSPGAKKVSGFIEDVLSVVFP